MSMKKRRPGSLELRQYREPREPGSVHLSPLRNVWTASSMNEMAGLLRNRLRAGIDPDCLVMLMWGEPLKVRYITEELAEACR